MHDRARPLVPSQGLHDLLRLCRSLAALDPKVTVDVTPRAEPVLHVAAVHAIESELGVTLPDDVLVVLAAGMPILDCASGLRLDGICDFADDERFTPDGVTIGRVYCRPFAARAENDHGAQIWRLGVPRGADAASTRILVDDGSEQATLASFMHDRISEWYRGASAHWLGALHALTQSSFDDASFRPALVGELAQPAAAPPPRWVSHPKFGRGKIVSTAGDKVVVDFDSGERRTLLAGFLVDTA
jgi:hypothetical protein